jgi:perosamine synthetase
MITSGQGGMVVTNNKKYYDAMKDLIDYNGRDNYKVRYNYPMTDIAASIGNVQLNKLPLFVRKRQYIASRYLDIIEKKDVQYWPKREDKHVNHFRFVIKFDSTEKRDRVKRDLLKKGITTIFPIASFELLSILLKQDKRSFPNAKKLAETSLSLPMYPSLTEMEIERITRAIHDLL